MKPSQLLRRPRRGQSGSGLLVLVIAVAPEASTGRELADRLVPMAAFDVQVASSVDDALRFLQAQRPEVIVLDARRDPPGGLLACARIRAASVLPVLLMAPFEDADAIARAVEHGATDFVTGPIPDALLANRVRVLARTLRASRHATMALRGLERIQRLTRAAQWSFDPEARTFEWSSHGATFPGLEGEGSTWTALLRWVHPDDRARVEAALLSERPRDVEYRLVLADGAERVVTQVTEHALDDVTGRLCTVGTIQDVTGLREAERQVDLVAFYDELTGLPNRDHACRFTKAAIDGAKRRGQTVAVLSIDLDFFRRVNDTFGHAIGNAALREVTARLRTVTEQEMQRHAGVDALVSRLGGDEFAVIVRGAEPEDASALFQRLAARIGEPITVDGAQVVVTCSAGIATYPASGEDVDTLLMHADSAMHVAKAEGRNGVRLFAADIQHKLERRAVIERRLRGALADGSSLELHYQPKVAMPSGRVASVEALLRWTANAEGTISPFELVSVAEESGLIHPLGDWVLRTACLQARAWSVAMAAGMRVAVNVSARQFASAGFADDVAKVLAETQLAPELLELEITEGVMMVDPDAASRMLERLKQLGVRIALDDFGTGYSSLAYLTRFPVDTLKIDRSFVTGIGGERRSEAIIGAIFALCRSLDIEVVAEGVETDAQLRFLERFGELEIQGWLFSKALAPERLAAWVENRERALVEGLRATG